MLADDTGSTVLAQSRPSGTSAASIYSPQAHRKAIITQIIVVEVAGGTSQASVFVDPDGTTYDESTALQFEKASTAKGVTTHTFGDGLEIGEDGNVAVKSQTGSAHTYWVLGRELDA